MLEKYFNVLSPSGFAAEPNDSSRIKEILRREGPPRWYNRIEVVKGGGIYTEPFDVDFDGRNFFEFLGIRRGSDIAAPRSATSSPRSSRAGRRP
jgi:hypothetical protein